MTDCGAPPFIRHCERSRTQNHIQ